MDSFAMSKQNILEYLENASDEQITEILFAIMRRHEESFPDYEMIVFSPEISQKEKGKMFGRIEEIPDETLLWR